MRIHFAFLAVVSLVLQSAAQQSANSPQPAISLNQVYAGFVGEWVGQLEYRDFSDNTRALLPTWLRVSYSADGRSLQFAYVYDDGPNKIVKEMVLVSIDTKAATASFSSNRDHSTDTYNVAGLPEFSKAGRGTLTLTGNGSENGEQVDVRITITLRRNHYAYQKETRAPGREFAFRDGYALTRKQAPE